MAGTNSDIVNLEDVWKAFDGLVALRGVSLGVAPGEIVCLLGDNGAGKSTLIRILTGVYRPDRGRVLIAGREVDRWSPRRARDAGIETVFQDKALAPRQSVSKNIFMGRELTGRLGLIALRRQATEAEALVRRLGFTSQLLDVNSPVSGLSGGEQEGVALARAMHFRAKLLILDEPTTALSLTQAQHVLDLILRARDQGIGVILVSHNTAHAHQVGDRFLVVDRGQIVGRFSKGVTHDELIGFMESAVTSGAMASAG